MRIVSLEPYITDVLDYIGVAEKIVGIDHRSVVPEGAPAAKVVTSERRAAPGDSSPGDSGPGFLAGLSAELVDLGALLQVRPDLVLIDGPDAHSDAFTKVAEAELEKLSGSRVKVKAFSARTLEGMYRVFEEIGECVGMGREGRDLAHRVKAQLMDWSANFHERTRNKRVTVVSSVSPLRLAGRWVPDLVRIASGNPQHFAAGEDDREASWAEIATFRSDVIIIAPHGYTLEESVRTLRFLERVPEWEKIPAVKRGELIFADGVALYTPGPRFLRGAAIVISGMAGLESGYITNRDEFYRLRFVELHRHRFK